MGVTESQILIPLQIYLETMISRTNLISAAILASAALTSPFAFAADGTITITGTVTAQTCTIRGFLSGSSNFTVPLIKVSASSLPGAGKPAGATQFNISLSACTPASGNVHTYFEPGPELEVCGDQRCRYRDSELHRAVHRYGRGNARCGKHERAVHDGLPVTQ